MVPLVGAQQAGEREQEGALAGTVGADDREGLPAWTGTRPRPRGSAGRRGRRPGREEERHTTGVRRSPGMAGSQSAMAPVLRFGPRCWAQVSTPFTMNASASSTRPRIDRPLPNSPRPVCEDDGGGEHPGLVGDVAADHHRRPNLGDDAAEGRHHRGEQREPRLAPHPPDGLPARRAEAQQLEVEPRVELAQPGCREPDHDRGRDDDLGDHHRARRVHQTRARPGCRSARGRSPRPGRRRRAGAPSRC